MTMLVTLTNVETENASTPFAAGHNAVFVNFTAGSLIVQGASEAGGSYTTFVTVPAGGMIEGTDLPNYMKVSTAATVYVIA